MAKHYNPDCKVYAVEPDAAHDAAESLRLNEIVSIPNQQTIADGANTPKIGHMTLRMMQKLIEPIVHITDERLIWWMNYMAER